MALQFALPVVLHISGLYIYIYIAQRHEFYASISIMCETLDLILMVSDEPSL